MKVGVLSVLAIVFITLKLTNTIDWSWWWVLSPWLIPVGALLVCYIMICICAGTLTIIDRYNKRSKK